MTFKAKILGLALSSLFLISSKYCLFLNKQFFGVAVLFLSGHSAHHLGGWCCCMGSYDNGIERDNKTT